MCVCVRVCVSYEQVCASHINQMHHEYTRTRVQNTQVNRALSWCDPKDSTEAKRLAAVMMLREMAEQSPAVFNVHVKVSWGGMRSCVVSE